MVTQRSIAEKLGVSQRLVAYALNGNGRMSDETRQKICEAAEQLGYSPNRAAQALVTGRTNQIALCFPFLGSSFYNEIIRWFEILTRETPYDLLVVAYDPEKADRAPRYTADGAIFVLPPDRIPSNLSSPLVCLHIRLQGDSYAYEKNLDFVQIDAEAALQSTMRHLIEERGLRRIAYVAPEFMMGDADFRFYSYMQAMKANGLSPEFVRLAIPCEELIRQQSHRLLAEYFQTHGFPDALFCCNDDIGIGAYRALHQLGRKVPEDIAIVGFDGLDDSRHLIPPMSSVHLPVEEVCRSAWQMLLRRIENPGLPVQFENYDAHLEVRESSQGKLK